ncbi:MAG: SprT family zinc-dependent metalloprotease [Rhodoferax sp.]|uniref:M48 family metallopeptidase n=1 Tax=Rhodoferax sp. TaxID=50421 RepID=UPI00271635AC|nr:SprT family zinc-dependent metalloprotease [Rhodoferax sp.]MDO8450937.1 SprT family zinc-dependent metalloprotease [Rhodoferax sp.]
MHPLLRFTLDLFESNQAAAPENASHSAIELIAKEPHKPAKRLEDVIAPAKFHHPRANREARLCDAVVAYEFKRGKRRTIGFSVGPDGLVVRAPKWVPLYEVEAALQEKSQWIIRKLGETRERHERLVSNRIEWRDGTSIPFLGEPVTVVLDPRHAFGAAGAELQTDSASLTLLVGLSHTATPEQIRDAVQAWLMRQARRVFIERLDHFAPQLQVQWHKLSLSNAGTRWGSARIDGAIRLNWRLIHFRQPVIDYVVAHELSHLRVMDHSPRFWDTVRSVVPDYAVLRGQLKDDSVPRWQ